MSLLGSGFTIQFVLGPVCLNAEKLGFPFGSITTRPLGPTVGGGLGAVDDNTASQLPQLALAAAAAAHFSGGFCGSAQCSAELFLLDLLRAAPCVCHVFLRPHAGGGCGSFCGVCSFQNRSRTSCCQSLDACSVSVVTLQTQTYRLGLIKSLHFSAKQSQETKYHKLEGAPIPTDFWQFYMNTGAELICRGCFRAPR